MWTIREEQVNRLDESFRSRAITERVYAIKKRIEEVRTEIANSYSEDENDAAIRETIVAADRIGIGEFEDQYEWAARRLTLGRKFWENPHIHPLLSDELIHQ